MQCDIMPHRKRSNNNFVQYSPPKASIPSHKGDYGYGSDSNSLKAKNHGQHHEQHFRVVELVMVGWYASTGRY